MESVIFVVLLILIILLLKFIFKINFKQMNSFKENKELEKITDNFPENIEIANEMLDMLNNKNVKVEQAKDTQTSLYIAITNKISIADMKNNYARIQTIAHECLHSCQDRRLQLSNFIVSNINIFYFLTISILTICKVIYNYMFYIAILLLLTFIQFAIRSFLEIDAMTRARFLAEKYIDKKKICTEEEKVNLLKGYEKINKIGIPFTIDNLLNNAIIKIIIYTIIAMIF